MARLIVTPGKARRTRLDGLTLVAAAREGIKAQRAPQPEHDE
jgi:hypothetical protein